MEEDYSKPCPDCLEGHLKYYGKRGYCVIVYVCDRCGSEFEKDVS